MMRALGLVLAIMVVVSGAVFAETVTFDVYSSWNCISLPLVPINSNPLDVFSGVPIVNTLQRFDASQQTGVLYDDLSPELFGGALLGDGFWLNSDGHYTISYEGLADGVPTAGLQTDMWISLPGYQLDGLDAGGMHLIGCPFNHNVSCQGPLYYGDNFFLTDGKDMLTWADAAAAGWCASVMYGHDSVAQMGWTVGYDLCDVEELEPGRGYWFQTYKDNLALIIPGN